MQPEQSTEPDGLDAETLAFAHRMFDLAVADPEQGNQSAIATATFFEFPAMLELLQGRRQQ